MLKALVAIIAGLAASLPIRAQSVWQVQSDPQQFQITAAIPGQNGNAMSFFCTRPGAPAAFADARPIRPHAPGNLVFMVNPSLFRGGYIVGTQAVFAASVDGRYLGDIPLTLITPEAQLATAVTYDHGLLEVLRKGTMLELIEKAKNLKVDIPLAGLGAALDQTMALCKTPVGQTQEQIASRTIAIQTGGTSTPVEGAMWYGELRCDRIDDVEAEFTIKGRNERSQYQATMKIGTPDSLSKGTGEVNYLGEDIGQNQIRFVVERQVRNGIGMRQAAGFVFDTATGNGTFDEGSCNSLSLDRVTAESPRVRSIVPRPANGGSFFAASTDRAKCEALIDWTGRLQKEFPDIDFYRTRNSAEFSRIKIKIFGDEDFVPVFGTPFDMLDYETRTGIRNFASRTCQQDPFVRDRMTTYRAAADRTIVGGGRHNELTSDGYTSTVLAVRKLRELRQSAKELAETGSRAGEDFSETAARLKEAKASIRDRSGLLWPSEREALSKQITDALARLAAIETKKHVDNLLRIKLPETAVQQADATLNLVKNQFGEYLTPAQRSSIQQTIITHRQAAVDALLVPLLEAANEAPLDLDSTKKLAAKAKKPPASLKILTASEQGRFTKAYEDAVTKRLSVLVRDRLAKLEAMPTSKEGLLASGQWAKAFKSDFDVLKEEAPVRDAWSIFNQRREALLEAALPAFEADLALATSSEEIDMLFQTYIALPVDLSLPVFLEYELLRELEN